MGANFVVLENNGAMAQNPGVAIMKNLHLDDIYHDLAPILGIPPD